MALTSEDAVPVFTEFIAETLNEYADPFVRPETVADVLELVPSANVDHVEPSVEYSIK